MSACVGDGLKKLVAEVNQPETEETLKQEWQNEFSNKGKNHYTDVYNAGIVHYHGWQEAADLHVDAVKTTSDHPRIIDAGGGTGRMVQKMKERFPNADIELLDSNPDMTEYALKNGISQKNINISDVTDMKLGGKKVGEGTRVPDASIDHVYSHSVIWMLEDPSKFFQEASRVLKKKGTLSVSTATPSPANSLARRQFISGLEKDMDNAAADGQISAEVKNGMMAANKYFNLKVVKVPTVEELKGMAAQYGLKLIMTKPIYDGLFVFLSFEKL